MTMQSPKFLNVDLDIESSSKLDLLVAEFGHDVMVARHQAVHRSHLLSVSHAGLSARSREDADVVIHALCDLVERLSSDAKRLWDRARRKEFDIGYEMRPAPSSRHRFTLRKDTIQRVAGVGATLAVTCYESDIAEPDVPPKRG